MDESRNAHARTHANTKATMLDHTHLAAPTLSHLEECPAIGRALASIVEQCLQNGTRFPHTLLVGGADSSKRVIAAAIAAEMAVPFHYLELIQLCSGDALHAALRPVTAGSVVLIGGLDNAVEGIYTDLARAIIGRERPKESNFAMWMREMNREDWQKASRQSSSKYADFTVILTARLHHPAHADYLRWVERHYFTKKCEASETARLRRLFRHTDRSVDDHVIRLIAQTTTTFGVRTIEAANAVTEHMRNNCIERLDQRMYGEHFEDMFAALLDPKLVRAHKKILERTAQAANKKAVEAMQTLAQAAPAAPAATATSSQAAAA